MLKQVGGMQVEFGYVGRSGCRSCGILTSVSNGRGKNSSRQCTAAVYHVHDHHASAIRWSVGMLSRLLEHHHQRSAIRISVVCGDALDFRALDTSCSQGSVCHFSQRAYAEEISMVDFALGATASLSPGDLVLGSTFFKSSHSRHARLDPVRGANQKIQWWSHVPETTAGPNERVGLMLQPVMGMQTTWARNTASPMASGARVCLLAWPSVVTEPTLTAVSSTTNMRRSVPMTSATKAWPLPTPACWSPFDPNPPVRSRGGLLSNVVRSRRAAPRMEPIIWANR
mmetsp:Transcript_28156/g.63733  ORF Transcript_28156/g.63733 Transcript_28156/m.63733 type:complete len:284 (+) Transcript_28156:273-1124(+)